MFKNAGGRLRRRAGEGYQLGDGVMVLSPDAEQEHLGSRRILEDVKNVCRPIDFKKSRAPRIGPRRRATAEEEAELRYLLRRMISEVLQKGRLLRKGRHGSRSPPQQLTAPLTYKDAKTLKKFHGLQHDFGLISIVTVFTAAGCSKIQPY
jgi:hypothetical protein